jgi:hypothetical protein
MKHPCAPLTCPPLLRSVRWLAVAVAVGASLWAGQRSVAAQPAPGAPAVDDDPGIVVILESVLDEAAQLRPVPRSSPFRFHGGRFRVFYEGYQFDCTTRACWFHGLGLAVYPTAFVDSKGFARAIRFGIGLAAAGESTTERTTWWQHHIALEGQILLGLQYPARATPYFELALGLGAVHRNVYNRDAIDFAYAFGMNAGLEVFAYRGLHFFGAIGWRRSVAYPKATTRYVDSVYLQVGFGL